MKPKSTLRSFLAIASSSLLAMSSAHATSLYWSADGSAQGGAGTWNTSTSNWGTIASGPFSTAWNNSNNDTAIFGGATTGAVALGVPITVDGLQFDTAGYTISSNTLTFGAAGNIAVNAAVNTGVTISSVLAGSVAVQKTGTGDLTLSGNNTYTGVLTLNGGRTLANTSVNALGTGAASLSLASGTLVFNDTANRAFNRNTTVTGDFQISSSRNAAGAGLSYTLGTLGIGANTLSIGAGVTTSGTAAVTFGATTLSGNATFNVINGAGSTGQLTLGLVGDGGSGFGITKTGGGNLVLASTNTYSGPTIISAGILDATTFANVNTNSSIGKGSALGSAADLVLNGGILRHSAANAASTNRLFSVGTAGGRLQSTHGTAGNFMKFTGTGAMDFNGQTGARTLTLDGTNTGDNTVALLIGDNSGATSISKIGAGTWLLTNANTYTGDTTVSAGTLVLDFTGGNDRIKNTNQLVLAGGTLQLRNLGTNTQTLASTSITAAGSRITRGTGYTSGVSDLGTLSASGLGTLDVSDLGVATTWIKASGNLSQSFLLDGRVTANSGAFLVKTDASGNLQTVATTDYQSNATISNSPGTSVRLISTGGLGGGATGSGFIGLSTAGTTNFETLQNNYTTGTTTIDVTNSGVNAGNILRLGASGVITSSLGATLTIGTTVANGGVLTAGGADNTAGTLYLNHANDITVNSAINNNGTGVVSLTKVGTGTLTLNGNNSFTGDVIVNGGIFNPTGTNTFVNITVNNGATLDSGGTNVGPGTLGAAGGTITFNGTTTYNPQRDLVGAYDKNVVVNGTTTFSMSTQFFDETFSGVLSGSGTLINTNTNGDLTFSNSANTFTGAIRLDSNGNSNGLTVHSLADSANPITFNGSNATLTFGGAAATSTSLLFDSRQMVLATSGRINNINSDANKTITINTDLGFSGTGTRTLTLDGGNTGANAFNGDITNNGASAVSLTKSGTGTWRLSGTNTYSGKTTVGAAFPGPGTLIFQGKQAVSPNTTFETLQSSGATARLVFLDDSAGLISLNNSWRFVSDGGPGTKNTHIFVGNNSTANGGNNPGSTQTGSTIALGGYTSSFSGGVNGSPVDRMNITGANGYKLQLASIAFPDLSSRQLGQSYTISLNPTTAPVIVAGGVTPFASTNTNNTPIINLDGTATGNEIQGAIADPSNVGTSNPLSLTKSNSSTWTLSGTNTYSGGSTISTGTLVFRNTAAKSASGTHAFAGGTTLGLGVGGTGDFSSTDITSAFAGGVMSTNLTNVTVTATTNVAIDTTGGNFTHSANITGSPAKGLTKLGANTLTLGGTNTYTGATTVSNGTLLVNGNISTSILTTVQTGATLGGSGTVGKTTVLAGGTLSPGNSPGTMTYTDTLGLAGSVLMEIDGNAGAGVTGGHDFINLTGAGAAGALTYGGTMTLDMGIIFGTGSYTWNLFDMVSETGTFTGITLADKYSGSLLDADLNGVWDLTSGDNTWQFTESTGVLGLTVIPEPRAALLGGIGMLMLLRRRRA